MKKLILSFLGGVYGVSKGIVMSLGIVFIILLLVCWLTGGQNPTYNFQNVDGNYEISANLGNLLKGNIPYIWYGTLVVFSIGTVVTVIWGIVKFIKSILKVKSEKGTVSNKLFAWFKEN